MNQELQQILSELYQSDPSLRQHEEVLKKLIHELMYLKPETGFNEDFKRELRRRLMLSTETKPRASIFNFNFMKKFNLIGGAVAICALLVAGTWYVQNQSSLNPSNFTSMLSGPRITPAGDNAFGSLQNIQSGGRGGGGGGSESVAMGMGGSGGGAPSPTDADSRLIAPEAVTYKYVYRGEELSITEERQNVLKRLKDDSNSDLGNFINRITLGLLDLNSFSNTKLQSFSFFEDLNRGYNINVSLTEGTVNINEYWPKWQGDYQNPPQLQIGQIPPDEQIIAAADAFIAQHGIPREVYGEPFVNNDWRLYYERTPDKTQYYIPNTMSVVYPLVINGQTVYDESGNKNGMVVAVRVPDNVVSGVWELTTQNYQSSAYAAETSVERILGLAEKGGFRNYYYADAGSREVEVELGTPTVSMVKLWKYDGGMGEELLVPSLIFPVTKEPADAPYWYRKAVIVPLVKDILDNEIPDPVRILPAVDVPSAGSTTAQ